MNSMINLLVLVHIHHCIRFHKHLLFIIEKNFPKRHFWFLFINLCVYFLFINFVKNYIAAFLYLDEIRTNFYLDTSFKAMFRYLFPSIIFFLKHLEVKDSITRQINRSGLCDILAYAPIVWPLYLLNCFCIFGRLWKNDIKVDIINLIIEL